jgi:hypothetical protein
MTTSVLTTDVVAAGSVAHCSAFFYAAGGCVIIAIPGSATLFFLRVRAVYYNNKIITAIFGSLWIALFGLSITVALSIKGGHLGLTLRCIVTKLEVYQMVLGITFNVFSTCVFVAITIRIMSFSLSESRSGTFFRGYGLTPLPRALLQSGQLYYLFVTLLVFFASRLYFFPRV